MFQKSGQNTNSNRYGGEKFSPPFIFCQKGKKNHQASNSHHLETKIYHLEKIEPYMENTTHQK